MTKIEIADSEWMEWPTSEGWYIVGRPRKQSFLLHVSRYDVPRQHLPGGGGCAGVEKNSGYRFARVELPIVPKAKELPPCTKSP